MRARDLVKSNIAYHAELNPQVWDDSHALRLEVRYKLLEIAQRFIEYLEVPNFKLKDVILRGSLCNYNYTQYSDFDLHLVTNYADLGCDITEQFYMAKKRIWNDEHDITIKGYEVELYVEDVDAKNISAGTYSVLDSQWLSIPKKEDPNIDERAVSAKARGLMTEINRARRSNDVAEIQRLQDKIKAMRQAGLDRAGEFSTENLAFKIIRNKGYLDKLYKAKNSAVDNELSLDESVESYSVKTDAGQEFAVNNLDHAKNKARSLLSYKKADKVYILKNGKAIYSWQLNQPLQSLDEDHLAIPEEVRQHLYSLVPTDVGVDEVGDYVIHFEGFTDDCKTSSDYQKDPEAVYQEVWDDFKSREGKNPVNYGMVGDEENPILYSVFKKDSVAEQLIKISQGPWQLHETRGKVEFKKSDMFDQTVAVKSKNTPGLLTRLSSFLDAKAVAPGQPWGGSDTQFISAGPLARAVPKLRHAHLTRDISIFYTVEGSDPAIVKLFGVYDHRESGTGDPANIKKQKSLAQQLGHQRI